MIVTYENLKLINFPIFGLKSDDLEVVDGLLRIGTLVIDDRNQIGDCLGKRRLQTPHKLCQLKYCYEDIPGLLSTKRHKTFVDNKGYCFTYERTKFCKVKSHRIIKVIPKQVATILKVANIPFPMIVKRPPPLGIEWVGVLYLDKAPWIPYEYSEERCADKRRKI